MSRLVLVHGAWHGAWCWRRTGALLREGGAEVHTPTLTGLGERAHLLAPEVGLQTHVRDVLGLLEAEELQDVTLVGHSYAGMLLADVAARAAGRIGRLVYLDALVPRASQSALELFSPPVREAVQASAARGGGWRVAAPLGAADLGVTEPADRAWVDRRLTDQALPTFTEPAAASPPAAIPKTYVVCTSPRRQTYVPFAEAARADPGWDYVELEAGHDAMVSAPAALAAILLAAAGPQTR
jgi:pimeloyl-ACP methyl ester carboxylesterase